jgi:glycosyltransferase involved in cell wall biosynthesis
MLTGDPDLAEIIVVDYESSDRTAAVGEEQGAGRLAGRALPPGSAGKGWALDQGLRAARGDLVLLLDAKDLPRSGSHAARPLDRTCRHGENPMSRRATETDLVTGAFSYSGSRIAELLIASGREVRALTHHPEREHPL